MIVKKGDPDFREALDELAEGYVYSDYPGLRGYAYQAEFIGEDEAMDIMERLLKKIVEIDWPEDGYPSFKLKGETGWRSIQDSEDFPQPSSEDPEDTTMEEEEA